MLEWCCCCLRGLLCDSSDTDDALWMVIILLYRDVFLASAYQYAVDTRFFEVVIVASSNEHLSLQPKK